MNLIGCKVLDKNKLSIKLLFCGWDIDIKIEVFLIFEDESLLFILVDRGSLL